MPQFASLYDALVAARLDSFKALVDVRCAAAALPLLCCGMLPLLLSLPPISSKVDPPW